METDLSGVLVARLGNETNPGLFNLMFPELSNWAAGFSDDARKP